jgi:hypothetical protein
LHTVRFNVRPYGGTEIRSVDFQSLELDGVCLILLAHLSEGVIRLGS